MALNLVSMDFSFLVNCQTLTASMSPCKKLQVRILIAGPKFPNLQTIIYEIWIIAWLHL